MRMIVKRLSLLTVLLFLIISGKVVAADLEKQAANELYSNPEYASALALQLYNKHQDDPVVKVRALYIYAQAEELLGNYDEALKALYEADQNTEKSNWRMKVNLYNEMSIGYCYLGDFNRAIDLNNQATAICKSKKDTVNLAICYNNRGIIYTHMEELPLADKFYNMALAINRSLKNLRGIAVNLNNMCLYRGNYKEKLELIQEAIIINKHLNSRWSLSENYNNWGLQCYFAGRYSDAVKALKKAGELAREINAQGLQCDNYEYLSKVYAAQGNYKKAYASQMVLYELSKKIQGGSKLRAVEQSVLKAQIQMQEENSRKEQAAYEVKLTQKNILLFCIVLGAVGIICYFIYQRRHRKKKFQLINTQYQLEQSEHEVAKLKLEQQASKMQQVEYDLKQSEQATTSLAAFIKSRNELLERIKNDIKKGYALDSTTQMIHSKRIVSFINQIQSGKEAVQQVNAHNQNFVKHLSELHPGLTPGEIHLAILLRAGMSTKEISLLTGTTPKTINMNRYRLRKALRLPSDTDLIKYLKSI